MDRAARLKLITTHIMCLASTEEEAHAIIADLMKEDWATRIRSPFKRSEQTCVYCGIPCSSGHGPTAGACTECFLHYSDLSNEVSSQRARALKCGLPATLTIRQWKAITDHFHGKCAYCQKVDDRLKYGVLIEHFIPISLGGGTTKENCVPSCYTCNGKKRHLHPSEVVHLFPNGEIQRVQEYLKSVS
jgi:5-methylcytosine-specific restriction endonuclease McrA